MRYINRVRVWLSIHVADPTFGFFGYYDQCPHCGHGWDTDGSGCDGVH